MKNNQRMSPFERSIVLLMASLAPTVIHADVSESIKLCKDQAKIRADREIDSIPSTIDDGWFKDTIEWLEPKTMCQVSSENVKYLKIENRVYIIDGFSGEAAQQLAERIEVDSLEAITTLDDKKKQIRIYIENTVIPKLKEQSPNLKEIYEDFRVYADQTIGKYYLEKYEESLPIVRKFRRIEEAASLEGIKNTNVTAKLSMEVLSLEEKLQIANAELERLHEKTKNDKTEKKQLSNRLIGLQARLHLEKEKREAMNAALEKSLQELDNKESSLRATRKNLEDTRDSLAAVYRELQEARYQLLESTIPQRVEDVIALVSIRDFDAARKELNVFRSHKALTQAQLEKLENATLLATKHVDPIDFQKKVSGYKLLKKLRPEKSEYAQAIDKYMALSQCRVFSEDLSEQWKADDQGEIHPVKMYAAHISVGTLDEAEIFQAAKHFLMKMHRLTKAEHLEASFYPYPNSSTSARLMYLAYTPDTSKIVFRDTIWDGIYFRDWEGLLGLGSKEPTSVKIDGSEMLTVQAIEHCS